jgi:hypothetical protein
MAALCRGRNRAMVNEKEYILFCDESEKRGKYFSNFYGGVLVGASQYTRITTRLNALKDELHLYTEVKWERVTEEYLDKYHQIITCFFDEIAAGHLKVRIMFTQNARQPQQLSREHLEHEYFLLYYQFLKHGFGLQFLHNNARDTYIRIYLDNLPETKEKIERFKGYVLGLEQWADFRKARIRIRKDDIAEIRSHEHVLLQCLDIVLGSMAFRLNDKHLVKPPGKRIRGKRTRAKEALYNAILAEIRAIHPHFNIGVSTHVDPFPEGRWLSPYLHWLFESSVAQFEPSLTKSAQRQKGPTEPTSTSDA